MKLAKSSHGNIQDFFRFLLKDQSFFLPGIQFYTGTFARHLTSLVKIHGLTIGTKVFIAPRLVFLNSALNKALPDDLIVHEIMHVLQYRKEGFWIFLYKYLNEYRRNLQRQGKYDAAARSQAYWEISYEREARQAASAYLRWKQGKNEKPQV